MILTLLAEFYDGQGSTSKSREFLKLGELQNIVSERLKAGLALEQEREQDGTNLYTEMYETVLDYKSMSEAYEALKSVEAGSRSKYTKEGYVSIICSFLDRQGLIIFIPEDEMIKTTAKLDNIMEYKILNKENYARIMETLGRHMSKISRIRILNLNYNNNTIKIDDETFDLGGQNTLISPAERRRKKCAGADDRESFCEPDIPGFRRSAV